MSTNPKNDTMIDCPRSVLTPELVRAYYACAHCDRSARLIVSIRLDDLLFPAAIRASFLFSCAPDNDCLFVIHGLFPSDRLPSGPPIPPVMCSQAVLWHVPAAAVAIAILSGLPICADAADVDISWDDSSDIDSQSRTPVILAIGFMRQGKSSSLRNALSYLGCEPRRPDSMFESQYGRESHTDRVKCIACPKADPVVDVNVNISGAFALCDMPGLGHFSNQEAALEQTMKLIVGKVGPIRQIWGVSSRSDALDMGKSLRRFRLIHFFLQQMPTPMGHLMRFLITHSYGIDKHTKKQGIVKSTVWADLARSNRSIGAFELPAIPDAETRTYYVDNKKGTDEELVTTYAEMVSTMPVSGGIDDPQTIAMTSASIVEKYERKLQLARTIKKSKVELLGQIKNEIEVQTFLATNTNKLEGERQDALAEVRKFWNVLTRTAKGASLAAAGAAIGTTAAAVMTGGTIAIIGPPFLFGAASGTVIGEAWGLYELQVAINEHYDWCIQRQTKMAQAKLDVLQGEKRQLDDRILEFDFAISEHAATIVGLRTALQF
ncbi:G domain-containing protein [Plasmodiophora brassicae]